MQGEKIVRGYKEWRIIQIFGKEFAMEDWNRRRKRWAQWTNGRIEIDYEVGEDGTLITSSEIPELSINLSQDHLTDDNLLQEIDETIKMFEAEEDRVQTKKMNEFAEDIGKNVIVENVRSPKSDTNPMQPSVVLNIPDEVPAPFKKSFFWPQKTDEKTKRKSKEKVPSVATSAAWRDYHIRKAEINKQRDEGKENHKREILIAKKVKMKLKITIIM